MGFAAGCVQLGRLLSMEPGLGWELSGAVKNRIRAPNSPSMPGEQIHVWITLIKPKFIELHPERTAKPPLASDVTPA